MPGPRPGMPRGSAPCVVEPARRIPRCARSCAAPSGRRGDGRVPSPRSKANSPWARHRTTTPYREHMDMKTLHTDVAVIGAGTAGLAAYRAARAAGKRALLIEGGPYGTTCARVGCMPSAADRRRRGRACRDAYRCVRRARGRRGQRGWQGGHGPRQARARPLRRLLLDGVENIPAEDKIRGQARFVSDTVLRVDEHAEIQASRVVIATGSRPSVPPPLRDWATGLS